jgi:hypothetical protein
MTRLALAITIVAAGCGHGGSTHEPSYILGNLGLTGYHLLPGSTSLPDGDIGYLVTSNGQGGYRLAWIDTAGSAAQFDGTISIDGTFDPNGTTKLSGNEGVTFTAVNRIDFSGIPGATLEGVDFVAQTRDPVYFDITVDGSHSGFGIYFTGATTELVQQSAYDPVAFISP